MKKENYINAQVVISLKRMPGLTKLEIIGTLTEWDVAGVFLEYGKLGKGVKNSFYPFNNIFIVLQITKAMASNRSRVTITRMRHN